MAKKLSVFNPWKLRNFSCYNFEDTVGSFEKDMSRNAKSADFCLLFYILRKMLRNC